jgi:hypothetical protein
MNIKSALPALCLCLMTGGANAAIVNYQSVILLGADASMYGYLPTDNQRARATDVTNYTNTVSASVNDSRTYFDPSCQCNITNYASANASSSVALNADLVAGIFTSSGSYSASSSDTTWLLAGGDLSSSLQFEITTPYAYTLDITASGKWVDGQFQNDFAGAYFYNGSSGFNQHQSGILVPGGIFYLYTGIGGCDAYAEFWCAGVPTGNFQYTLTLTPTTVPVPAAAWLFGSGLLGLIGVARRKAA